MDTDTQIGPQVSPQQIEKIASYVEIGRNEGAEVLIGGKRATVDAEFADGYYFEPTVLKGDNKMRVFQEEIFGPVLAVTTFKDDAEALEIANDTLYGLGRRRLDARRQPRLHDGPRHQGRPGLDQLLPPLPGGGGVRWLQDLRASAARTTRMMLDHYSQTKNLLVSYSTKPLGLF